MFWKTSSAHLIYIKTHSGPFVCFLFCKLTKSFHTSRHLLLFLRGALWRAVVVRTPVRVLRLALGDRLHGHRVQSAAHAVAAAVGGRRDSGAALPWRSRHVEGFRGEALGVGFGIGAGELIRSWWKLQGGGGLFGLSGRLRQGVSRRLRSDGALEDLCGGHAVTRVWAAALFQQQQFELLVGGAGPLYVPVDGPGDPLQAGRGHGGGGWHQRDRGADSAAGRRVPQCSSEAVLHTHLAGVLPAQHFPFGPEHEEIQLSLCELRVRTEEAAIRGAYLCITANRSSVVRVLLGDRNTLSSSGFDSSLWGGAVMSLGVESAGRKQSTLVKMN